MDSKCILTHYRDSYNNLLSSANSRQSRERSENNVDVIQEPHRKLVDQTHENKIAQDNYADIWITTSTREH